MDREVVVGDDRLEMTRVFKYPREAVFAAWTQSDQLAKWWGCRETESVTSEIDLRVGGAYRYVMHMQGGLDVETVGTYVEVVVPERIVTKAVMGAGSEFEFESTTTVEFIAEGPHTRLKLKQVGLPPMPGACDIIAGGTNDSWDKLEAYLGA